MEPVGSFHLLAGLLARDALQCVGDVDSFDDENLAVLFYLPNGL
jgi:hypothetical protein